MSKCRYPDWEGGVETGEHKPDKDGFCNVCGMTFRNTEKDAMKRFVDSSDRKAAYDMRKQGLNRRGTGKPQGSREILRASFIDRATITWFTAYATATGLILLALFL